MAKQIQSLEDKFLEAEDRDLITLLCMLLPDEDTRLGEAISAQHLYIRQLEWIESTVETRLNAVKDYMQAEKMQLRWDRRKLSQVLVEKYIADVKSGYARAVEEHRTSGKETEDDLCKIGQNRFCASVKEANKAKFLGEETFLTDLGTGFLHKLSDRKEIGWHPKWSEKA